MDRKTIGIKAEQQAARLVKKSGMRIIARNARAGRSEIDLIGQQGQRLVFIEVRCKTHQAAISPALSVDWRKQARVRNAAQRWLNDHPEYAHYFCRFDVIAVEHQHGKLLNSHWIKDAFS